MLRGNIITHEGLWNEAHIGRSVQQGSTLRPVNISEKPDGLPRHIGSTPEVDLEHGPGSVLRGPLELTHEAVTGVVEDEVDTTNFSHDMFQRGVYILAFGHIELEYYQLVFGPPSAESVQGGGGAEGCNRDSALLEN